MHHVLQLLLLALLFERLEVEDGVARGTELDKDDGGLFDRDVPIVLQLIHQSPDGQRNELGVAL